MIAQIINLSPLNVFRQYCDRYNIASTSYSIGVYGLELRNLSLEESDTISSKITGLREKVFLKKNSDELANIFLIGSLKRFKYVAERISNLALGSLSVKLFNTINFFENYELTNYKIGNKSFDFSKAFVMGILNVTPDSFSDGGKYFDRNEAVNHALQMIDDGADIIDIGGESSRPGAKNISAKLEIERIIPVIKKILEIRPDSIISVDTTKQAVAEKSLQAGAKIVNDISGGTFNPEIIKTVADHNGSFIIMHMKGSPSNMQVNPEYEDVVEEVYDFLFTQVKKAADAGITNIFIDPGIGFGKTVEHNFELIHRLEDLKSLSYPIMIGISRKSFIGKTLNLDIQERDTPTAVMESMSLSKGARVIRTHNVKNGVMVRDLFNHTNNGYTA